MIVARHVSPDGILTLLTDVEDDDWMVGFEGTEWHTHGDLLMAYGHSSPQLAVEAFVDEILKCTRVIAVERQNDAITGIWVTDDPARELADSGKAVELRYWDGTPYTS